MNASLLHSLRAQMIVDPATETVMIRFAHDGHSFDAAQRMLDLIEYAERGELALRATRRAAQATNTGRTQQSKQNAATVRRAAKYYQQANGDDAGMMAFLLARYGKDTDLDLSERTIRRYLGKK